MGVSEMIAGTTIGASDIIAGTTSTTLIGASDIIVGTKLSDGIRRTIETDLRFVQIRRRHPAPVFPCFMAKQERHTPQLIDVHPSHELHREDEDDDVADEVEGKTGGGIGSNLNGKVLTAVVVLGLTGLFFLVVVLGFSTFNFLALLGLPVLLTRPRRRLNCCLISACCCLSNNSASFSFLSISSFRFRSISTLASFTRSRSSSSIS